MVDRRLHELKKDCYANPGSDPESIVRETMRSDLTNVFAIWLMATLHKKQVYAPSHAREKEMIMRILVLE